MKMDITPLADVELIAFDTELTGLVAGTCRIAKIGTMRLWPDGNVFKSFSMAVQKSQKAVDRRGTSAGGDGAITGTDESGKLPGRNEGVMSEDIEECLKVVLKALKNCDLPATERSAWCTEMLMNDRVGFICDSELRALRDRFKVSRSP
ncbi:MAG: hypothetical protein ACYC6N_32140, partial [Pirellulaceae bacterium]